MLISLDLASRFPDTGMLAQKDALDLSGHAQKRLCSGQSAGPKWSPNVTRVWSNPDKNISNIIPSTADPQLTRQKTQQKVMRVTRGHKVITRGLREGHKRFKRGLRRCHERVTKESHDGHKKVMRMSQEGGHKRITRWSPECHRRDIPRGVRLPVVSISALDRLIRPQPK